MSHYDHGNVSRARAMRKDMTPWERKLWYRFLRYYDVRFLRQRPIGPFIVDFYCASADLVVELDGGGHYEAEQARKDAQRTAYLEGLGLKILRFSNLDVDKNFYGVCTVIDNEVTARRSAKASRPPR